MNTGRCLLNVFCKDLNFWKIFAVRLKFIKFAAH